MYKTFVFVIVALLASEAIGMRLRRQSDAAARQFRPVSTPSTTTAPSTTSATQTTMSLETRQCIVDCPVTAEYNPVCGTNGVVYPNPGRLLCAQACGVNVQQLRAGPCPTN